LHRRIAYERLFVDAFNGNPALFVRDDEVKAAWSWIDSVSDAWKDAALPLQHYPAGSWGPESATHFLPPATDAQGNNA
ncbi:glucose-6-phosphate dehydrogenase, partial [Xanthomonas vasicola]